MIIYWPSGLRIGMMLTAVAVIIVVPNLQSTTKTCPYGQVTLCQKTDVGLLTFHHNKSQNSRR